MRKTFEAQTSLNFHLIEETPILKSRDASQKIHRALLEIYKNKEYLDQIFAILNQVFLDKGIDMKNGRPGMNLWQVFVLATIRVGQNLSYDALHVQANLNMQVRQLLGIHSTSFNLDRVEVSYQNILDNMEILSDDVMEKINDVIVNFGDSTVFKKKRGGGFVPKNG